MAAEAWMETCFIAITPIDGNDLNFTAYMETSNLDPGDKAVEGIPMQNGGRITRFRPQTDGTITFEAYFTGINPTTGDMGVMQYWADPDTLDASEPLVTTISRNRTKVRVVFLWTEDTTVTTATTIPGADKKAKRIMWADAYITSPKEAFTDGILKTTVTITCPPFDTAGAGNMRWESQDGGGGTQIPAVGSYTSSNKF